MPQVAVVTECWPQRQAETTHRAIPIALDKGTSVETLGVSEVGNCVGSGQIFVSLFLRWSVSIMIIRTIFKQLLQKRPQGEGMEDSFLGPHKT